MNVVLPLDPHPATASPSVLARTDLLTVERFAYPSGVTGLVLTSEIGRVVLLPFLGQQVWEARMHGRDLKMASVVARPRTGVGYLANNGAYFVHCGGSAMGNPGPDDDHPLHGELPAAPYEDVTVRLHDGAHGEAVTVSGTHRERVSFGACFDATASVTMVAGSGVLTTTLELSNASAEPRPLMYLAHINLRPAVGGEVHDPPLPEASVRTRAAFWTGDDGRRRVDPADVPDIGALLAPGVRVEPELVQSLPAAPDPSGWVVTRQEHAAGGQDVVAFRSAELTHRLRWLRRSPDEQAFGLALPATAEADGVAAETAKGNVRWYAPGDGIRLRIDHGALTPGEEFRPRPDQVPVPGPQREEEIP